MKNLVFSYILLFLGIHIFYGQKKEIKAVEINKESKLTIKADAYSVNNVTITVTPTSSSEGKNTQLEVPFEFKVAPFNEKMFSDKLLEVLTTIEKYQTDNKRLDSLLKEIKGTSKTDKKVKELAELYESINKVFSEDQKNQVFASKEPSIENIKEKLPIVEKKDENGNVKKDDNDNIIEIIDVKKIEPELKKNLIIILEEIAKNRFQELLDPNLHNALYLTRTGKGEKYYTNKTKVNERLDALFRYFDSQIILIFAYDTEPVAGTLYYNKKVEGIQYFTDRSYELYFNNKVRNYHKLIKRLHTERRDFFYNRKLKDKGNEEGQAIDNQNGTNKKSDKASVKKKNLNYIIENHRKELTNYYARKDSIAKVVNAKIEEIRYNLSTERYFEKVERVLENYLEAEDDALVPDYHKGITVNEAEKLLENTNWINNSKMDLEGRLKSESDTSKMDSLKRQLKFKNNILTVFSQSQTEAEKCKNLIIDGILKRQTDKLEDGLRSDTLRTLQYFEILNFFTKNRKEYKSKYIYNPKAFYDRFKDLSYQFRALNRNKRKQFIYDKVLRHRNKQVYDSIGKYLPDYDKSRKKVKEITLLREYLGIKRNLFEKIDEYTQLHWTNYFYNQKKEWRDANNKRNFWDKAEYIRDNYDSIFPLMDWDLDKKKNYRRSDKLISEISSLENEILELNRKYRTQIITDTYDEELVANIENLDERALAGVYNFISDSQYNFFEGEEKKLQKSRDSLGNRINQIEDKMQKHLKNGPLWNAEANLIELDFNEGFAERILMYAKITELAPVDEESRRINKRLKTILDEKNNGSKGNEWETNIGKNLTLKSLFPYGFSSSKDYDDFKEYKLAVYKGRHREFEVRLDSIFPNYVQKLENNRFDFSPKNEAITMGPENMEKEKNNSRELKKDTSSKLFNLSVYTDFKGFEDNPNGLMQFEFSKLIPLYTKRKPSLFGQRYIDRGFNFGRFNYIIPQLRWARLDAGDDDENLVLSFQTVFEGGEESQLPFVTILDLLRFENVSVGADLNLLMFDLPTSKLRFELNVGGRFGRTKVLQGNQQNTDTTDNVTIPSFDTNNWRFYPEFLTRLRPEERYGASLSLRPVRFDANTTDFSVVSSETEFRENLQDDPKWLHQIEFNAFFSPTGRRENRFFFRYRYTNTSDWATNGFSEWQLGYALTFRVQNKE